MAPFLFTPVAYCTLQDMQNRLSVMGVSLRVDDVPPTDLGDVIIEASTVIDEYCFHRYTPTAMLTSAWVEYRATDIACYFLCERRGNPVPIGIAQRYERTMKKLERVYDGKFNIYDCPERRTPAPTMSNMRVIFRPFPRSVVETGTKRSTGQVTQYDRTRDPWDIVNAGFDLLNWVL